MNYLVIGNSYVMTLEGLLEWFKKEEAKQFGSDLFNELKDYLIDGDIEAFLRDIGENDMADRIAKIEKSNDDPELMRQLITTILEEPVPVVFDLDDYLKITEADVIWAENGKTLAFMELKTLKKAKILVNCIIRQGSEQRQKEISLNGQKGEIHKIEMEVASRGEDVVFMVNGSEIRIIHPFPGSVVSAKGVSFTLRFVKGGSFQMGATPEQDRDASEHEKPAHSVKVNDFFLCDTPVTQLQWRAIMGNSNPSQFKGSQRPVTNVTYQQCLLFVKRLNSITGKMFRLPTEEEWEYAARGGTSECNYKFSGGNDIDRVAWYHENGLYVTHDVAGKEPNNLGLYDMSGNVWEWCSSDYREYWHKKTGAIPSHYKVSRGGCATSTAKGCRTSRRYRCEENHKSNYLGFRLAM